MSRGILLLNKNESGLPTLGNDLEISLSQIESGCISAIIEGKNVIIIKDEKISSLKSIVQTDVSFENIARPEFPTVAMKIKIKMENGLNMRYEHFFLTESPEEINFLISLKKSESFLLYFISQTNEINTKLTISRNTLMDLNLILDEINLPG